MTDRSNRGDRQPTTNPELWTTSQCAEHCGVTPATYRYYVKRLGAPGAVSRQPGRSGENLHDAAAVREWQENRPGKGAGGGRPKAK